jgi:hypothetical protein
MNAAEKKESAKKQTQNVPNRPRYEYKRVKKGEERGLSLLPQHDFPAVFVQPRTLLFLSGIMNSLSPAHSQNIEIGSVSSAIAAGHRNSHLMRSVEHHVVFPQSPRTVKDAEHALLHMHILRSGAPRQGVVLLALAAFDQRWRPGEGHAVFGVGEALFSGLADGAGGGDVVVVVVVEVGATTPIALLGIAAGVR